MLGLPQPDSCETSEGVPFLRLEDDATDVTLFLTAIYDSRLFERPPAKTSYEAVAGILRLSTKYDVQYLRQRAILHLDTLFPLTLEEFATRNELRTIPPHKDLVFDASLLAREVDVLWILPQVLYIISNHPVGRILDGFLWNDSVKEMAEVDRNACIHALKAINTTIPNSLMGCFAVGAIDDCQSPTRCPADRCDWGSLLWKALSQTSCEVCLNSIRSEYEAMREEFWKNLPEVFGMPELNTLKAMRDAALSTPVA
ncbi:hypothetical protein Hypma_009296 [Hypsizygus marmoreus]|uniref:BTB domain-containing protein n=1 Tax=Hypsizygus marmoreus TaxID=39966 RepID=A0A369JP44_HYPMA|nr:hypothetical protein Hypma_009296 [Hypsizygus marmoreus]